MPACDIGASIGGVFAPKWGVQNGYQVRGVRGASGKLGSGVASRALAAVEGLAGGSESSVVGVGQIRFAAAGLPGG